MQLSHINKEGSLKFGFINSSIKSLKINKENYGIKVL